MRISFRARAAALALITMLGVPLATASPASASAYWAYYQGSGIKFDRAGKPVEIPRGIYEFGVNGHGYNVNDMFAELETSPLTETCNWHLDFTFVDGETGQEVQKWPGAYHPDCTMVAGEHVWPAADFGPGQMCATLYTMGDTEVAKICHTLKAHGFLP